MYFIYKGLAIINAKFVEKIKIKIRVDIKEVGGYSRKSFSIEKKNRM